MSGIRAKRAFAEYTWRRKNRSNLATPERRSPASPQDSWVQILPHLLLD